MVWVVSIEVQYTPVHLILIPQLVQKARQEVMQQLFEVNQPNTPPTVSVNRFLALYVAVSWPVKRTIHSDLRLHRKLHFHQQHCHRYMLGMRIR